MDTRYLRYYAGLLPEMAQAMIERGGLRGLAVFAHLRGDRPERLDFLADFTFLRALRISVVGEYDFSWLKNLGELEELAILMPGHRGVPLEALRKLRKLEIHWIPGFSGLETCIPELLELELIQFTDANLRSIGKQVQLRALCIRGSRLKTLEGVCALRDLETLSLADCRSLRGLKGLADTQIKSLEIDSCKFGTLADLAGCGHLKTLHIVDCGRIDSVQVLGTLGNLSEVSIIGNTRIEDGDLRPLAHVAHSTVSDYEHYTKEK